MAQRSPLDQHSQECVDPFQEYNYFWERSPYSAINLGFQSWETFSLITQKETVLYLIPFPMVILLRTLEKNESNMKSSHGMYL